MSVQNVLNTGLYNKMAAGTALTTSLGGTFLYYGQAPDHQATPFVVWSYTGGIGYENITPSNLVNELVFVRVYADNPALAGTIDGQLSALLHKQELTVSGYTNFWMAREQSVGFPEIDEAKKTTWMSGAFYRVRLTQ